MIEWHRHHIIPRHAGGDDTPTNLLKCNKKMHETLHRIRYEEHGQEQDRVAYLALAGILPNTDKICAELGRTLGGASNNPRHGKRGPDKGKRKPGSGRPKKKT